MTTKIEYLKEVKQKFDELNDSWKIEREKIDGVTRHISDDVRKQVDEKRVQLRDCRSKMEAKIEELKSADDNSWRGVMTGVDEAWKAVFDAFRDLVDDLKKR